MTQARKLTAPMAGGRVPHFSRSLREVGLFAETIPTLNRRSDEFFSFPPSPVVGPNQSRLSVSMGAVMRGHVCDR